MYCTVVGDTEVVPLGHMKNGNLAVIVNWPGRSNDTGRVVQRHRSSLIMVGAPSGKCCSIIFDGESLDGGCIVRILRPGETIQIH